MTSERAPQRRQHPVRVTLEQALRDSGKVAREDRPVIGERLGEIAAELDPQRPLLAVRRMWERAWGPDHSFDKRKRLVRLPGEELHSEYEAAAPTWCKLIRAAAELLVEGTSFGDASVDYEQVFRRVLRGTSYRPGDFRPAGPEVALARELHGKLCEQILAPILRETGLQHFWAITDHRVTPVGIEYWSTENLPTADTDLEVAAQRAQELAVEKGWTDATIWARFTTSDNEHYGWEKPSVEVGALIKRFKDRIFVLPEHIASQHPCSEFSEYAWEDPDDHQPEGGDVGQWLREELKRRNISYAEFCKSAFEEHGYGWRDAEFDRIFRLALVVERYRDGNARLKLRASEASEIFPADRRLGAISAEEGYQHMLSGTEIPLGLRGDMNEDWVSEYAALARAIHGEMGWEFGFIGYVRSDFEVPFEGSGWLDEWFSGELGEDLTCQAREVRFIPAIHVEEDVPEIYRKDTPLGALFLNAIGPKESTVGSILLQQAHKIVELGTGYLNALGDYYRSAMADKI